MKVQFNSSNYNPYLTSNKIQSNKNIRFGSKTKNIAVYAGSFDPITNGHMDLIKEASKIFNKLIVLIAKNPKKAGFLPIEDRWTLIEKSLKRENLKNVEFDAYTGLTVNYAKEHGAKYLIRGMRSVSDFDNEMQISKTNEILAPDIKTVFLFSSSANSAISSSVVREILASHGDVQRFVPKPVYDYLMEKFK